MILVIAHDALEAQELRAAIGTEVVLGRQKNVKPGIVVHTIGQHFGQRFDRVWVRTQTMQAITRDPVKWEWWRTAVLTRLPPAQRPEYI